MRRVLLLLILAGCAADRPDPREGFSARNVGRTIVTFVEGLGTQAVYLAPDGGLYLWTPARPGARRGHWRFEPVEAGETTNYRAMAGINRPAEELATGWRICFRYRGDDPETEGDWNCAPLAAYEGLIVERAAGDALGLTAGTPPGAMPAKRRLGLAALRAL